VIDEPHPYYEYGWWTSAYELNPVADPPSLRAFMGILEEVKGNETGWPVWLWLSNRREMLPRPVGQVIECWLNETGDDAHADFWRADPRGRMFLLRGYQEDSRSSIEPGKYLDLTLPIWRTGECLLHASRLAARLGAETVDFSMTWTGLRGRELSALASPQRHLMPGRLCAEGTVRTSIQADAVTIPDALPELVERLVAPLYERFEFFEPPEQMYVEELTRMRRGI
jgi:transcriptional regulator with XRE-family HTH domain